MRKTMTLLVFAVFVVLSSCAVGPPTADQVEAVLKAAPPDRTGFATTRDSSGSVYVFGGQSGTTFLRDLWKWDGSLWSQVTPIMSPAPRVDASLAYDPAHAALVLFGGVVRAGSGTAFACDTWEWSLASQSWSERVVSNRPSCRSAAMFYAGTGPTLFGGSNGTGQLLSDVWQWNGSTWIAVS